MSPLWRHRTRDDLSKSAGSPARGSQGLNFGFMSLLMAAAAFVIPGLMLLVGNSITNHLFSALAINTRGKVPGSEAAFELVQWAVSAPTALDLAVVLAITGAVFGILAFRARQRVLTLVGLALNVAIVCLALASSYLLTHSD
jgi:hypothetical protein